VRADADATELQGRWEAVLLCAQKRKKKCGATVPLRRIDAVNRSMAGIHELCQAGRIVYRAWLILNAGEQTNRLAMMSLSA